KADGDHVFTWKGDTTCKGGDLAGRYISPLHGPYKVHIYVDEKYTDEAEFKVLYHSIKIRKGPFTPDEQEPKKLKDWVQYKLNELGYYGGPVGKDTEKYLEKAVIRYKVNHKDLHQIKYSKYDDSITPKLVAALRAGDNGRNYLDEAAFSNGAAVSNILVE